MNLPAKTKISVLLITLNEAQNLIELLPDLNFADEIVIVDSGSTDETKKIANSFPKVRFLERNFDNYANQRNFAIEQSQNEWILFIDADERLTSELKSEILEVIESKPDYSAFLIYRKFFFQKKPLHFSGWQTDKIFRLFKKSKAQYIPQKLVHEKLKVEGTVGILKNKLIHFSYNDYESYQQKMINYGRLKALEKFNTGFNPNFFHKNLHALYSFLYNYIVRLGFLDGTKGIIICYLNALSISERYKELELLSNKNKLH